MAHPMERLELIVESLLLENPSMHRTVPRGDCAKISVPMFARPGRRFDDERVRLVVANGAQHCFCNPSG
jgi:hypothetical protein